MSQATTPSQRPSRTSLLLYAIAVFALLVATAGVAAAAAMRAKPQEVRAKAAGAPPRLAASAEAQMNVLRDIKTTRSAVQRKIGSRLYLGILKLRSDDRTAQLPDFRFVHNEADGRVAVDVIATSLDQAKSVMQQMEALGGTVRSTSRRFQRITGRMPLQNLESLAASASVKQIREFIPPYKNAVNVSEGDATHGGPAARSFYGVNGTGQKVCVLSDAVDSIVALQGTGDVANPVDVLPGQAGSGGDEGSAMLEIVHDLAPGAAEGFATAFTSEAQFAQNILDLATDGCTIIVDDVIYLDESPFQDSPVAQAVNTVTGNGVIYFSSAGNEGNTTDLTAGTWEGDFLATGAPDPAPLAGANLHNFGDGGNSILVEFGGGNPPLLIWAEHYDLVNGIASTDFDLYDMDGGLTTIFDASTDIQDGSGGNDFPIEFIGGGTFGGERLLIDKFAAGSTSSQPMMNLIVFRGELDDALVTGGATRGHSAAAAAFSTAATPAAASFDGVTPDGPYPGLFTSANESESFTSDGLRRIILSPTGVEITPGNRTSTGGVVRQKPDITAADGVSCAAPGFNPFYGTSAAAPHAAALAALCKQAVPAITPAALRTALTSSAIDIEAAGVDKDTGAGIVMASPFLAACGASPQAFLDDGTPVPTQFTGDGDAFIEPNETWDLAVPLTNVGGINATAISAVLSTSTLGVTVTQANSTYPDLAPTVSANNNTLYRFSVGPAAACGVSIDFTLTVTYTGGPSPQVFNFSLSTGSPGAPIAFSYAGPPVPILDSAGGNVAGPTAVALLPIVSPGNLVSLEASIDGTVCNTTAASTTVGIDHTFANDLQIDLKSPSGTLLTIINRIDGGGNNFCQIVLDDTAGTNIQTATTAPFTGTWQPASPLAAFAGEAITGIWELHATDFFIGDIGNIRAFSLNITPAVCNAPALTVNLTATKAITGGNQNSPGTVTYTITLTNTGTGTQLDNPGNEFTDTLPAGLTVGTPTASTGTVSGPGVNPVTWNGTIAPSGSVTITIPATIASGLAGTPISNQGTANYDADVNGTNESVLLTDDPATAPVGDATIFIAGSGEIPGIPTLSEWALMLLGLLLAGAGVVALRRS
ncbi:MAG TPA: IPTL-CTERM sorting domain-containing protein [Thermoanaerobaculia bacterium]|nr:IPTL-CTERM sorting domain-containing protein [Thermoanaerobaculia bacterium]